MPLERADSAGAGSLPQCLSERCRGQGWDWRLAQLRHQRLGYRTPRQIYQEGLWIMWTIGFADWRRFPRFPSKLARRGDRRSQSRFPIAWADTTMAHGRLMLTVLGGLAEFERDLIRARTSEGRERAKARGVKLGRKPKLTEHQKLEAIRRRDVDGETVREIARSYNVSHSTISRLTAS